MSTNSASLNFSGNSSAAESAIIRVGAQMKDLVGELRKVASEGKRGAGEYSRSWKKSADDTGSHWRKLHADIGKMEDKAAADRQKIWDAEDLVKKKLLIAEEQFSLSVSQRLFKGEQDRLDAELKAERAATAQKEKDADAFTRNELKRLRERYEAGLTYNKPPPGFIGPMPLPPGGGGKVPLPNAAELEKSTRGARQLGFAMNQMAFAADDFASTITTGGWPMAIRSMGNNLSVVLAQINPLVAILGTAATAGLAFALSESGREMLGFAAETKKSEEPVKSFTEILKRQREAIEELTLSEDTLKQKREKATFDAERMPQEKKLFDLKVEQEKIQSKLNADIKAQRALQQPGAGGQGPGGGGAFLGKQIAVQQDELRAKNQQVRETQDQIDAINRRENELVNRQSEARANQATKDRMERLNKLRPDQAKKILGIAGQEAEMRQNQRKITDITLGEHEALRKLDDARPGKRTKEEQLEADKIKTKAAEQRDELVASNNRLKESLDAHAEKVEQMAAGLQALDFGVGAFLGVGPAVNRPAALMGE